jgi:hypothetical protein
LKALNVCAAAIFVVMLGATPAHAQTGFCPDPTAEQKFWLDQCSGSKCRLAVAWATNCVSAMDIIKAFLSKPPAADEVDMGRSPEPQPQPGPNAKEDISGLPKSASSKERADDLIKRLSAKVFSTTDWDGGLGLARVGLTMCADATNAANMRDAARAKERCALAEGNIRTCLFIREGHSELRTQLQGLIDGGQLGADTANYRRVATAPYPVCPTTLPTSGKTPAVALADYLKFWDTKDDAKEDPQKAELDRANNVVGRCDAMRREISDALDLNELDQASASLGQFESACSREHETYYGLARLYRQRLEQARAAQPPTALIRRGDNSGSALFKSAIDQAAQDEKDRPAREAAERLAKARAAEAERLQKEQELLQEQAASRAPVQSEEERRAWADALKGLAGAVKAYSDSKAKAGVSTGGAPSGSIPVCTPGAGYDAKRCSCALNPAGAGCPGAPQSGGINCWGQGPECRAKFLQGK